MDDWKFESDAENNEFKSINFQVLSDISQKRAKE